MGTTLSNGKDKALTIGDCPAQGMEFTMNFVQKEFSSVHHASISELAKEDPDLKNPRERVIILDIRAKKEYEVSHLPKAIWIAPNQSAAGVIRTLKEEHGVDISLDESTDEHKQAEPQVHLYCYCSVGYRSSIIADKLQKHGIKNVHNLRGSIFEWVNQGYSVVDRNGNVANKVHTFNTEWGVLLNDPEQRVC